MNKYELSGIPLSRTAVIADQQPDQVRSATDTLDNHLQHSRRCGRSRRAQDAIGLRIRNRERQQIADQVHDDLGGIATALKSCVDVALLRLSKGEPVPIQLMTDAVTLATACFTAIRKIGVDLRPTLLEQMGFWLGIDFQLRCLSTRSGMLTSMYVDARLLKLTFAAECERVMFRVISEAITNAGKHSCASRLAVRLFENHGLLIARIEDDGIGHCFERDPGAAGAGDGGRGLRAMRELAQEIGAYLLVEAAPGAGCTVCLSIPIGHCNAG